MSDVRVGIEGDIGRITLDRPTALNALTFDMVEDIAAALREWEGRVAAVLIDSSHPKVFCAGGDIRAVRQFSLEERPDESFAFFSHEYRLNKQIATYAAPIVSLIDGVCMGGGMGLSIHGAVRVVTDKTLMAMPETAIGFFPDVGASFFLSRLPGEIGMYLGLTGARVSAGDAMYTGLGTHFVATLSGDELQSALVNRGRLSAAECVQGFAGVPPQSELAEHRGRIDACFSGATVHDIVTRLRADASDWARKAGEMIQAVSPQSLQITHALLRWAADKSLEECLRVELALGQHVIESHDFVEGVRAVLVDKDRNPSWRDAAFEGIEKDGSVRWREHTLVSVANGGTL